MNTHVAKNFATGRVDSISGVPVRVYPSSLPLRQGLRIVADSANINAIFIGNQGVTAFGNIYTDGFPLRPGEREIFYVDNTSGVFLVSNSTNPALAGRAFWFAC